MELGIIYPSTEIPPSGAAVHEFASRVETLGYDYIEVHDHVLGASSAASERLWGPYTFRDSFHDPFVLFSNMAAVTTKIGFCTGVLVLPQRQTALVAKQAADVAVLSDNRLRLSVGIGWNPVEYQALGMSFNRRGRRADEQLVMLRELWERDLVKFDGEFGEICWAGINPRPNQTIPLWVGGASDAAFRRAARHGDGFCFSGGIEKSIEHRNRVIDMVSQEGRNSAEFGSEFVVIPPSNSREMWPRNRPSYLASTPDTVARWRDVGGSHATVFTQWMGLRSLEEHLAYASEAIRMITERFRR